MRKLGLIGGTGPESTIEYYRQIEDELELGRAVPETRRRLVEIARRLVREEGAEAIVLGCTELPLILNVDVLGTPCLDVMRIHIDKLVSLIVTG